MGPLSGKFSPGLLGKIFSFDLKRFACCLNVLVDSSGMYQNRKHFSHHHMCIFHFRIKFPTPDVLRKCLREDVIESVSSQEHHSLTQTLMFFDLTLGIIGHRAMNVELNWSLWTCEDAQSPLHLLGQQEWHLGILSVSVCMCTHLQSIQLFLMLKASTSYKIASSNIYMRYIILWSSHDTCWPCLMHPISNILHTFQLFPNLQLTQTTY